MLSVAAASKVGRQFSSASFKAPVGIGSVGGGASGRRRRRRVVFWNHQASVAPVGGKFDRPASEKGTASGVEA